MKKHFQVLAIFLFVVLLLGTIPTFAIPTDEKVDLEVIAKIREEGLERSQVMEIIFYLSDVYGPRITGSPYLRECQEWCVKKMTEWGLENAAREPWGEFGRGWSMDLVSVHMLEPAYAPIIAYPRAWTGSTDGVVKGQPVLLDIKNEEDFEKYRGQLKGKIVLKGGVLETSYRFYPNARRFSEEKLKEFEGEVEPGAPAREEIDIEELVVNRQLREKMTKFLAAEEAAVILEPGPGRNGTVFVGGGGSRKVGDVFGTPQLVVAVEHYNRLVRLLEHNIPVAMEIEVKTSFYEEDQKGYNVVAEIPGTDPQLKDEVVMLGGHIDGCHASTGATDNAAGIAVSMEAVRILKAIGVQPRRTIRVGFWDAEEQGIIGSAKYVSNHFGDDENPKPDFEKFSVYFNYDNGSGKIRGVWAQSNEAAVPIFKAWLEPFHDLGATTISLRNTGGTDHLSFDGATLPGFQFIQDPLGYSTITHHSNMDDYDHCSAEDLKQSAVIMASFVYHAAMRDERFPRKPPLKTIQLDQAAMEAFVGEYAIMGMEAIVAIEGSQLTVTTETYPKVTLHAISETEFVVKEFGINIKFKKDETGKATTMTIEMGEMKIVGHRVK